jgi:hypothetical protein
MRAIAPKKKKADALSSLLPNFSLVYAVGKVQKNQEDLKLNEIYRLPICANDVFFLIEENTVVTRG